MALTSKKVFNQEVKRLTILQAAKELFLEKKYSAITMDMIAHRAEITKKTLYSYFPSKLALFIHVFDEYLQQLHKQLAKGAKKKLPSDELILSLVDILYKFTKENERFMRLYWTLDSDEFDGLIPEELMNRIKVWTKAIHEEMIRIMDRAHKEGLLHDEYDTMLIIHLFSAMNKGIFVHTNKENKFNIANVDTDRLYMIVTRMLGSVLFKRPVKSLEGIRKQA
ncbi:MAG TPA: TetR/AcrR family transcriptional regulator [Deltaproteobacteria bacterium]|nr:TetR/AcrR family transcriptional regulator [Deltaproteobacteria bacterium]